VEINPIFREGVIYYLLIDEGLKKSWWSPIMPIWGYGTITLVSLSFYTTQLARNYGADLAVRVAPQLQELVDRYRAQIPSPTDISLSERDSILITYANQVHETGRPFLQSLAEFCEDKCKGVVSGIHILPFYPSSSDDGFSVMEYRAVDPALGSWQDIERMGRSFRLMFDCVINHSSVQGHWFKAFLRGDQQYHDYFLTVEGSPDLSKVVRPRTTPLLTEFQAASGSRRVWTTFSADQADLNFHHPQVLLEMIDILLSYARHGAQFIRLDAVAYLWKELGTTCINLPQTHAIVQLLRAVLDQAAPHVRLITETNVPPVDNLSYFGDGTNEAQLVYNFALPPLVLHTLRTGDSSVLSSWASELDLPSDRTTFFNFLASHDGIGLNPVQGILSSQDIEALVTQTRAHGGLISYKQNPDGSQSPYELNINYFDALSEPSGVEPLEIQISRFMAAEAIMLSLRGVPGIYFHSLFGSRSWTEGLLIKQYNRAINREKLDRRDLELQLADPASLRSQVFNLHRRLLARRFSSSAFHPGGLQKTLDLGRGVFAVLRTSPDGSQNVLCLQNITSQGHTVSLPNGTQMLEPYQTLWRVNL
jgi:sucrose phosphorylase